MIHFLRTTTVLLLLAMFGTTHVSASNMERTAMYEQNSNDATTEKEEISLNISFSQNTLRYNTENYKSFAEPEVYFSISDSNYEIEDQQKITPTKTTDNTNVVTITEDGTVTLTGNVGKAQIIYTYLQGTCWKVGDTDLTEYTYVETMAAYTVVVTETTPTEISTAEQWKEFASNNNEHGNMCQYIKLTNDIILENDCPIVGTDSYPFSGIVDGNGHTLTINFNKQNKRAVPFYFVDGAYIKNLRVAGNITSTKTSTDGQTYEAAGFIALTQSNSAYNKTKQKNYKLYSETVIENCVSSATIHGNNEAAGFIAIAQNAFSIKNCLFDGKVESDMNNVGRFIGRNHNNTEYDSHISNCLSVGEVNASGNNNNTLAKYYENVFVAKDNDNLESKEGEEIAMAKLADGSKGWKLNDNGATNIWKQNISYEKYPSPFSKHEIKQGTYMSPDIWVYDHSMTTMALPVEITPSNTLVEFKVYTVDDTQEGVLQLTEYTEKSIPAGMPVILYNPTDKRASFYANLYQTSFYYNEEQTDKLLQTQYLDLTQSGLQTFYAPAGSYVMQKKQDDTLPAFYQVQEDNQIKVRQFHCYLKAEATAASAPKFRIEIDGNGNPTGIGSVTTEDSTLEGDGKIYDLSGRRVSTMQKGQIYIVGGHKFMIK